MKKILKELAKTEGHLFKMLFWQTTMILAVSYYIQDWSVSYDTTNTIGIVLMGIIVLQIVVFAVKNIIKMRKTFKEVNADRQARKEFKEMENFVKKEEIKRKYEALSDGLSEVKQL